jgi:PDZ domain-containing protein
VRKAALISGPSGTSRRGVRPPILGFAVAGLIAAAAISIPLPLLVLEPGPAPDLMKRTEVSAPTYPSRGAFHFTTTQITSIDGVTMYEALKAAVDPDKGVLPRESIYPPGFSHQQTERAHAAQMTQSQDAAAVAALKEVGLPYEPDGVLVTQVVKDSDANRKLQPGDIIVKVDEAPIVRLADITRAVAARQVGKPIQVSVKRAAEAKEFSIRAIESDKEPGKPSLGVMLRQHHKPPFDLKIDNAGIGGPSAGLMLALSIYDLLVPDDLTRGKKVAGTGTIENRKGHSGVVGEVGAIKQKVESARRIGAQVFLVPRAELEAAQKAAEPSMLVVGVSTLREAISALSKISPD